MAARRVRDGKRVDTWEFYFEAVGKIRFDVYMVRGAADRVSSLEETYFVAINDDLNFEERGTDVNELRERARKHAKENVTVTWSPVLYVTWKGSLPTKRRGLFGQPGDEQELNEVGASLGIEVELWEVATIAGKPHYRRGRQDRWSSHRQVVEGELEQGPSTRLLGRYSSEASGARAVVPDTPENRAALLAVVEGIEALAERVGRLFEPERILATLAGKNQLPLLPAASSSTPAIPTRKRSRG